MKLHTFKEDIDKYFESISAEELAEKAVTEYGFRECEHVDATVVRYNTVIVVDRIWKCDDCGHEWIEHGEY